MGEHTPGPWSVDEDFITQAEIVGRPTWPCVRYGFDGEWTVAKVEDLDDHPAEALANARLIAAAPELLDALNMIACGHGCPMALANDVLERLKLARTTTNKEAGDRG